MNIEVNNIQIHYEALGERKSIILLNPNSVNTGLMKFIANRLKGKYKVYILIEDVVVKVKKLYINL